MKSKKETTKAPSATQPEKKASISVGGTGGVIQDVASTKVSRRTLMKGTAAVVAVVGVSTLAMRGSRIKEQAAASSASYVTISPTASVNTSIPTPGPIVATTPFDARTITLNVNGTSYTPTVEPRRMLVDVLREDLGLIATKKPCDRMCCGGCTVLIDGVPHESCTILAVRAVGHTIVTSEITTGDPVVNALQQAWVTSDGGQCSYCASGQIMAATYLLKNKPNPTVPEIKAALSGNLCRCGNYLHIIDAVQAAAASLGGA